MSAIHSISSWLRTIYDQLKDLADGGSPAEEIHLFASFMERLEEAKEYFAEKLADSYTGLIKEMRNQELVAAEYHYGKLDNPAVDFISSFTARDLPLILLSSWAGSTHLLPQWAAKGIKGAMAGYRVYRKVDSIFNGDDPVTSNAWAIVDGDDYLLKRK